VDFSSLLQKDLGKQIELVESLSATRNWGITSEQLLEAEATRSTWPKTAANVVIVLVPYLRARAMYNAVWATIRDLWHAVDDICNPPLVTYESPLVIREGRTMGDYHLLPGIEPFFGVRWESIYYPHHCGIAPATLRSPNISPHAGIIALGIHHPELVKHMGCEELPNLVIPGYIHEFHDGPKEAHVLVMEHEAETNRLTLTLSPESCVSPNIAVPVFFRP